MHYSAVQCSILPVLLASSLSPLRAKGSNNNDNGQQHSTVFCSVLHCAAVQLLGWWSTGDRSQHQQPISYVPNSHRHILFVLSHWTFPEKVLILSSFLALFKLYIRHSFLSQGPMSQCGESGKQDLVKATILPQFFFLQFTFAPPSTPLPPDLPTLALFSTFQSTFYFFIPCLKLPLRSLLLISEPICGRSQISCQGKHIF